MNDFCAAGICPVSALRLDRDAGAWLARLCPGVATVMVYAFPYFAGNRPGNLSLYARGRDYHAVIYDALSPVAGALQAAHPGHCFRVLVDDSPLPEVRAAALAGLGAVGENGLLFHPKYGSYVFIGTIVTDLALADGVQEPRPCLHCGRCRRACPAGAIGSGGVDASRCLSALTQRGGGVTEEEAGRLRLHPLVWGCDLCQQVCPMNREKAWSENPAFRENLVDSLRLESRAGLTPRTFLEKYPERDFTWRGPAPLRRNLIIKTGG